METYVVGNTDIEAGPDLICNVFQDPRTMEMVEWLKILEASKTDISIQHAVERVKILYYLSKENGG